MLNIQELYKLPKDILVKLVLETRKDIEESLKNDAIDGFKCSSCLQYYSILHDWEFLEYECSKYGMKYSVCKYCLSKDKIFIYDNANLEFQRSEFHSIDYFVDEKNKGKIYYPGSEYKIDKDAEKLKNGKIFKKIIQ